MRTLDEVFKANYMAESEDIVSWCDSIYDKYFSDAYKIMKSVGSSTVFNDLGFVKCKLSDEELERILTELPVDLYTASESLNRLKLELEMIKLKYKQIRRDLTTEAKNHIKMTGENLTKAEVESAVQDYTFSEISENELLIRAYESVISRAENERSACRELIMGAKKVWDSRRMAEQTNPIKEVVTDNELPDYKDIARNQYVK